MKWRIITLALLTGLPVDAYADGFTAAGLRIVCSHAGTETAQERDQSDTVCSAYLLGLTDAMFVMQSLADHGTRTCMPKEIAIGVPEAKRLFENYLGAHPETANNSAGLVAGMAVVNAFKCGTPNETTR